MSDKLDIFSQGFAKIIPPAKFEAVLLYGGAGSGKTHFALSASELEEFSPVLVIDTENSTSGVIDNFRQRDPENPEDIAFDPEKGGVIDVVRPIELWGDNAYKNTLTVLDAVANGDTIYKTVIIDVADVLQAWGLQHHDNPRDGFFKWAQIDKDLTGAPLPDKVGGGKSMGLFYRLKMSGVLSIFVVHEKRVSQAEGPDEILYQWGGQGQGKLGGIPDAVLYFKRRAKNGGGETTVSTIGGATFEAKNRFNLPATLKNPSFKDVVELAKADKN